MGRVCVYLRKRHTLPFYDATGLRGAGRPDAAQVGGGGQAELDLDGVEAGGGREVCECGLAHEVALRRFGPPDKLRRGAEDGGERDEAQVVCEEGLGGCATSPGTREPHREALLPCRLSVWRYRAAGDDRRTRSATCSVKNLAT